MKLIAPLLAVAASFGTAKAVSVTLTGIANSTIGLVTSTTGQLLNGTAYFYSTAVDLSVAQVASVTTRASFEALLGADPGAVRGPVAFTNGAFTSSGPVEMGAVGNITYMVLITSGGMMNIYQGPSVPSLGAVTINPANITENLRGSSGLQSIGGVNSGYQFIPEPSTALLGALGALGLLRRRR
ncbi:PEP-CTERM sorting domain-containing protein [Luteolibacter soli]|uniref:PEP-CTERM sorting domain-containing protein n=1 Tax=Luteolibacter soli TaxID=3135280 RepID=A0ABU9B3Z3_9BACT